MKEKTKWEDETKKALKGDFYDSRYVSGDDKIRAEYNADARVQKQNNLEADLSNQRDFILGEGSYKSNNTEPSGGTYYPGTGTGESGGWLGLVVFVAIIFVAGYFVHGEYKKDVARQERAYIPPVIPDYYKEVTTFSIMLYSSSDSKNYIGRLKEGIPKDSIMQFLKRANFETAPFEHLMVYLKGFPKEWVIPNQGIFHWSNDFKGDGWVMMYSIKEAGYQMVPPDFPREVVK